MGHLAYKFHSSGYSQDLIVVLSFFLFFQKWGSHTSHNPCKEACSCFRINRKITSPDLRVPWFWPAGLFALTCIQRSSNNPQVLLFSLYCIQLLFQLTLAPNVIFIVTPLL